MVVGQFIGSTKCSEVQETSHEESLASTKSSSAPDEVNDHEPNIIFLETAQNSIFTRRLPNFAERTVFPATWWPSSAVTHGWTQNFRGQYFKILLPPLTEETENDLKPLSAKQKKLEARKEAMQGAGKFFRSKLRLLRSPTQWPVVPTAMIA